MSHPRDRDIVFVEEGHIYTYLPTNMTLTSVTTIIHRYFPTFQADEVITKMQRSSSWSTSKYFHMSREEIKESWERNRDEAASAGTALHRAIELYLTTGAPLPESKEAEMFRCFWNDKKPSLEFYRAEWIVYDEAAHLAGSIDCLLRDRDDGQLVIVDWKRSKIKMNNSYERGHGPFVNYEHCNYNHYALQLNFYRHMIESKYGLSVKAMVLVVLHPDQDTYQCLNIPRIHLTSVWGRWKK